VDCRYYTTVLVELPASKPDIPATSAQALERTRQPHSCYTGIITQNSKIIIIQISLIALFCKP